MTQKERVMKYLKQYGTITPYEAFYNLGITKLATVISDLINKENKTILKAWDSSLNRYGEKVIFMRYFYNEQQLLKWEQDKECENYDAAHYNDPCEIMFYKGE